LATGIHKNNKVIKVVNIVFLNENFRFCWWFLW